MSLVNKPSGVSQFFRVIVLGLWLIITIFPLYWVVITSFKPSGDIYTVPVQYWPEKFSIENYQKLFDHADFGIYLLNSFVVATVAGGLATLIALFGGYVLARFQFAGKGAVLLAFLLTQMVPGFIALAPLYIMLTKMNLTDSLLGLSLVYVAVCIPFSTVMLRGFFVAVPDALEEAAMIDGLSRAGALMRVIVPVMKPGIIAAFIFNFVNCWNELFLAVTLLNDNNKKTVPPALSGFISTVSIDWASISAAAVLTIIPTLVLFSFASKYIVQGLTTGAVKG